MTPPDGQNGRMRMYLWNTATPFRDGDLEAGIVIHELSHGLSTRMTGGPANSGCLGWGESGGMGEGWGGMYLLLVSGSGLIMSIRLFGHNDPKQRGVLGLRYGCLGC